MDVAVQGFGNVGSNAAKILHDLGFKIVAISDISGGLYNKNGIDPYDLLEYHQKNGALTGYKKASSIPGEEIFSTDCDILIPAALENQIKKSNAALIKARFIAEAANAPTTPIADKILQDNGKFIIPDILCNAGGVTVSYFEWVQGNDAYFWSRRKVNLSLRDIMEKAFYSVYQISKDKEVNMRNAANILGIGTVAEAVRLRGIYP